MITSKLRSSLLTIAAVALLAPVGATADSGKGRSGEAKAQTKSQSKSNRGKKAKNAEFKGEVKGVDLENKLVTVEIKKASKWGRALKGETVQFDVSDVKKIKVADVTGDGIRDLADVNVGDRAHVGARIAKDAAAPFKARKFHAKAPEPAPEATP